ncbi:hypothetical protein D3C80_1792190 [compost metagenome]
MSGKFGKKGGFAAAGAAGEDDETVHGVSCVGVQVDREVIFGRRGEETSGTRSVNKLVFCTHAENICFLNLAARNAAVIPDAEYAPP